MNKNTAEYKRLEENYANQNMHEVEPIDGVKMALQEFLIAIAMFVLGLVYGTEKMKYLRNVYSDLRDHKEIMGKMLKSCIII